jgi:hypothetical protein
MTHLCSRKVDQAQIAIAERVLSQDDRLQHAAPAQRAISHTVLGHLPQDQLACLPLLNTL